MSAAADRLDELGSLTPPGKLIKGHGGEAFHEIGVRWAESFRLFAGLRPDDRVLDVGCGPGRMALALGPYLDRRGTYDGFDIRPKDIAWCKQEIEPRWSRSRFQLVDVENRQYNPDGAIDPAGFRFPYATRDFSFVLITSVFTHLLPETVAHYLAETERVLRRRGRCVATFFLLNDSTRRAIDAGLARFAFPHEIAPGYRVEHEDRPEEAVAHDEHRVRSWVEDARLRLVEPIRFGGWSGAYPDPPPRHSQDTVVLEKPPARWLPRLRGRGRE